MASSYSPLLRFELPASGEQAGLWGNTENVQIGTLLEQALAGVTTITLSSTANYTLTTLNGTPDEARSMTLVFIGNPTGAASIILPALQKTYHLRNATAYTLTFKTSAQVGGVTLVAGGATLVHSDGVNIYSSVVNVSGNADTVTNGVYTTDTSTSGATSKIPVVNAHGFLNIGGATPASETTTAGYVGVRVGTGALYDNTGVSNRAIIHNNAYQSAAGYKRVVTGYSGYMGVFEDGTWQWATGGTAAADTTISYGTRMSLSNAGALNISGVLTQNSDRRYKTDIEPIRFAMEKVRGLLGITYRRTDWDAQLPREMGLIAQDVQVVAPEAVRENDEKRLTVAYGNLVGLVVEALKEIDKRLAVLERAL